MSQFSSVQNGVYTPEKAHMCSTLTPQFSSNAHLLKNKRLLVVHRVEAIVGDSFSAKLLSHCVCGKAIHVHLNVSPDALV